MNATTSKQEIIDWILNLEDSETLMVLEGIKRKATFNFDEEFKKGIPAEEFKEKMLERIRNYPWKKNCTISK